VFLSKSAQFHENKRVVISGSAKECKRAQKSAQECEKKGDRGSEIEDSGSEEPVPPTPLPMMHEYQKKRLTEIAIRN
jgi:hypothetical protein